MKKKFSREFLFLGLFPKHLDSQQIVTIALFLLGSILAIALRFSLFYFESPDYATFVHPSYLATKQDGISGFQKNLLEYTPAYPYLLYIISVLFPSLPDNVAIKSIPVFFEVVCAIFVYKIVLLKYGDSIRVFPILAFFTVLFAPTVILNGSYWGQVDIIYTTALVISLYFLVKQKEVLAFIFLGISLAFKAQGIFLLPVFVALFLKGRIKLDSFFIIPLIYLLSIIPAWFFGRSFLDLLGIYLGQADIYPHLTMNAPNMYQWFPDNQSTLLVQPAIIWALAMILFFVFIVYKSRAVITPAILIHMALLSVLIVPYFLPKMHDRYFFAADIISIVFSFYFPKKFYLSAIIIMSSFCAYTPYLFGTEVVPLSIVAWALLYVIFVLSYDLIKSLYTKNKNELQDCAAEIQPQPILEDVIPAVIKKTVNTDALIDSAEYLQPVEAIALPVNKNDSGASSQTNADAPYQERKYRVFQHFDLPQILKQIINSYKSVHPRSDSIEQETIEISDPPRQINQATSRLSHRNQVILLILIILLTRLGFSWIFGAEVADISQYHWMADILERGENIYQTEGLFHYTPIPMFLPLWSSQLAQMIGLPFHFVVKWPMILADIGITLLLWWQAQKQGLKSWAFLIACGYAFNPVSLLITSFHGSYSVLPTFFTLLAYILISFNLEKSFYRLSALSLGMAIGLRGFPVLFVPFFLRKLNLDLRRKVVYLFLAALPSVVTLIPFLLVDYQAVIRQVFSYSGVIDYGWIAALRAQWFITTGALYLPGTRGDDYLSLSKWLFLSAYAIFMGFFWWKPQRFSLLSGILGTLLLFFTLYGGISSQYLVWTIPFALIIGSVWEKAHTWTTTAALVGFYLFYFPGILFGNTPIYWPENQPGVMIFTLLSNLSYWLICLAWFAQIIQKPTSDPKLREIDHPLLSLVSKEKNTA